MYIKNMIRWPIWLESNTICTKSLKTSEIVQQSDDWLLNIPLQYIHVRLDFRLFEQPVQLRIKNSLRIGCVLVTGEDSLFDREITKIHDMDSFLHRVMRQNKPTIQEAVIAQLLEDLQLRYIPQWILPFQDRHLVFDFLIEPNLVIECTLTERRSYRATNSLRNRAIVIDRKFKALKSFDFDSFTLILVEATQLLPEKLKPIKQHLDYTNKLTTSIIEFEAFLGDWKQNQGVLENESIPTPTTEVEVPAWAVKDPQSNLERFI